MFCKRRASVVLALVAVGFTSCGAPPAPTATAPRAAGSRAPAAPVANLSGEPAQPPMPVLRTGAVKPVDHHDVLAARTVARLNKGGFEILALDVSMPSNRVGRDAVVRLDMPDAPFAFLEIAGESAKIWVRRPEASKGPVSLDIYGAAGDTPGEHFRVRSGEPSAAAVDPALAGAWAKALAVHLMADEGAFYSFAGERVQEAWPPAPSKAPAQIARGGANTTLAAQRAAAMRHRDTSTDLSRLMETTTGITSVQEALQSDRSLFFETARAKATEPLAKLTRPKLEVHPWREMQRALKTAPPPEPLAAAAPADFYFVRASGLTPLLTVLDQVDTWGTPAARMISDATEERGLAARYQAQLGLARGPLTQVLGPRVVQDVAIMGSDPYFREGTDLTFVFRVTNKALFDGALAQALAAHATVHGAIAARSRKHQDVDITVSASADLAVRQERATVSGYEIVSNSPGAMDRVLDAVAGKTERLADEPDFAYMLARDADVRSDVLAYMGDRFVAEVVGPRQKIQEARRQIALAELSTPGYAALLYGFVNGTEPPSTEALVASKLLRADELTHVRGGSIQWTPGKTARSSWGTPAALTPLIDLPALDKVTPAESRGYAAFARSYESYWAGYIDPVAVRATLAGTKLTFDLRQLPLLRQTEYRELANLVMKARFDAEPSGKGLRATVAISEDANERKMFTRYFLSFAGGKKKLALDWLGEFAVIGVADRTEVAAALLRLESEKVLQRPAPAGENESSRSHAWFEELAKLPLYAEISVRSATGATLALAALRGLADQVMPDMFQWGSAGKHRDVSIVRVGIEGKKAREAIGEDFREDMQIFYAMCHGAIVVSLQEWTLRNLIDERLDGKGPVTHEPNAKGGTQLAIDLRGDAAGGLFTSLAWIAETALHQGDARARARASALLLGAPHASDLRALAMAYFGEIPTPADGGIYSRAKDGIADPNRGTLHAPVFPVVPVPGSPVAAVLGAVAGVRTEVSFDDEGAASVGSRVGGRPGERLESLRARATVTLR